MRNAALALAGALALALSTAARAATLDSFEDAADVAAWRAADWAEATLDASGAAVTLGTGAAGATDGGAALEVPVRFLGQGYAQGFVSREAQLSFAGKAALAADVTLPAGAPAGMRAKLVLFLGPNMAWTEPADSTPLSPGATVRVGLPLAGAFDPAPDRALLKDVRGYGVKIEGQSVTFQGQVAIDRVRLEGTPPPAAEDLSARSVGTFGGFLRASGPDIPASNGFLCFVADSHVASHALRWVKLDPSGGDFRVAEMRFPGVGLGGALRFRDWTTLEATEQTLGTAGFDQVTALLSRAFPAVRYTSGAASFALATGDGGGRAPAARLAVVISGQPQVIDLTASGPVALDQMSEPWALVYAGPAAGWDRDAPLLLTFERRPRAATPTPDGLQFAFDAGIGSVQLMPFEGLKRRPTAETTAYDAGLSADVLARARALVPILAAFPVSCAETFAVDAARRVVTVTDEYTFSEIADAWGTAPAHAAPLPPVVYRAGEKGYPVAYPSGAPQDAGIATYFGPFATIPGDRAVYTLPLPAGLERLPVALRVLNDPAVDPVRSEVERAIRDDAPNQPSAFYLDNDDRAAATLAEAYPTLAAGSPARAKAVSAAPRLLEHGFLESSLQTLTEPVTGQRYLNNAKYWASQEPFDKEWYTGRQLAALAQCAETFDLDLARGLWPKALGLYRYDRIFFDWATGSVESSVFGFTELCDGIHFAWEGMLGMARLARHLGDAETYRDAAYRAARQQAALFACWHEAEWLRDLDCAIGHVSNKKLDPSQVETRGAIDGFTEDAGATTLEFSSFWETANYLGFDVPPQFSFYRDFGLEPRLRVIEYDAMPKAHPRWTDGNAFNSVDNRYYGDEFAGLHIAARAALFHDDPVALFAIYQASAGTQASQQWYTMRRFGIAGAMLLAVERAKAPVVEVPAALARVESAVYDAKTKTVRLELLGRTNGSGYVRSRAPGGRFKLTPVFFHAGKTSVVRVR
jgi:hypothetical protein